MARIYALDLGELNSSGLDPPQVSGDGTTAASEHQLLSMGNVEELHRRMHAEDLCAKCAHARVQDEVAEGDKVNSEKETTSQLPETELHQLCLFSTRALHELMPEELIPDQPAAAKLLLFIFRTLEAQAKPLHENRKQLHDLEVKYAVLKERSKQNFGNVMISVIIGGLLGLVPTVSPLGPWAIVILIGICILLGFILWRRQ